MGADTGGSPRSWKRLLRKLLLRVLFILAAVYAVVVTAAYAMQRKLTYFPTPLAPGEAVLTRADVGFEEVRFSTGDGVELHGVFRPPPRGRLCLLFLHGNAGNLTSRLPLLRDLIGEDLGGLLFDYRGYGKSGGSPTESGLYEDGSAALAWLASVGVPPERVVLFGKSLGTGVAVEMARSHPVRGLALESPYTSLPDAGQRHFPILPVGLLMRDRFDSLSKAPGIRCPVFVVWGTADRVVAPDLSETLFDALPDPKARLVLEGAGHNDIQSSGGKKYWDAWREFLKSLD